MTGTGGDTLPLTYGEYIVHEGGKPGDFPSAQRRLQGKLITYTVETEKFKKGATLPVRRRRW